VRLPHTQRAYRKEAERFLLWAILDRKTPLSSMTVEDCAAYRDFLADPKPRERWCGPRSRERWSALWRPFEGPLSEGSRRQALAILANLYGWLVQSRYLLGNPFAGVAPVEERSQRIQTGRSFTQKQWRQVQEAVNQLPVSGRKRRLQFVLGFAYATGLRLSELVQAKVSDLESVDLEDGETGWMLHVTGKGGRRREVPLPEPVMHLLAGYLAARGLDPAMNRADPQAFLIGKVDDAARRRPGQGAFAPQEGVAAATLAAELKRFFRQVGREIKREDPKAAGRFERASAHWLRHTHGSHAVAANVPIEVVQNNLGHASLSTTTIYVTSEKRRRYREMAKFLGAK
jgi:site-specific recombinase XerD